MIKLNDSKTRSIELVLNSMSRNINAATRYMVAKNRTEVINADPVKIVLEICNMLGVDIESVRSDSRERELVDARKIIGHNLSLLTTMDQYDISDVLGYDNRSSVSTLLKKYIELRVNDKEFRSKCQAVDARMIEKFSTSKVMLNSSVQQERRLKMKTIHTSKINFNYRECEVRYCTDDKNNHMVSVSDRYFGEKRTIINLPAREFLVLINEAATIMQTTEFTNYLISDEYEADGEAMCDVSIKSTV